MSTNYKSSRPGRRLRYASAALFLLLALSQPGAADAAGNSDDGAWRLQPEFSARVTTYYQYQDGVGTAYPALGAQLSIERSSPNQAFAASLFADLELTTRAQQKSVQLLGGWVRYHHGRWTLRTGAAHFDTGHTGRLWLHASKLQFRLRPRHKLALEAIGVVDGANRPAWQFVYDTELTKRLALTINVGLGSEGRQNFGSGAALSWDLH